MGIADRAGLARYVRGTEVGVRRYTVRQLSAELERVIAARWPSLEVEAEVGQVGLPASGHAYLTLRDGDALLNAVCWRDTWRGLPWRPALGDKVVCRGRMGTYPGKSGYQLFVHGVTKAGEGSHAADIAMRRARLEADGLLDPRRKRPLPTHPRVVGVVTSLSGAALQDFLKVSRQRYPAARIVVAGALVQGPTAPPSLVAAMDLLLEHGQAEVIVLTRGGGGKEDLLAFQDEGLARYVAACPVPTVSAVGHQVDTTLCDLVADAVAPTPTAAAMLVLPDGLALAQRVDELDARRHVAMARRIASGRRELRGLASRLRHPSAQNAARRQRVDDLHARLVRAVDTSLRRRAVKLAGLPGRLERGLVQRIPVARLEVDTASRRLLDALVRGLRERRLRTVALHDRAAALSPQAVLGRGYAVVVGPTGVVRDPSAVSAGDTLRVHVERGTFGATVTDGGSR